jgi:hypothetical protein
MLSASRAAAFRGRRLPVALIQGASIAALLTGAAVSTPAEALTIRPTFDSSITRLSDASTIERAFDQAASQLDRAFANPTTVNITVSWGSIAGMALPAGDIGSSIDNLSGPYGYASVVKYLTAEARANPRDASLASAVAHLPKTDPLKVSMFEVPYAEAKAMGMLPKTLASLDGYIGFSSSAHYDFNPVGGISAGYYDFESVAEHEMEEVLGRSTGLEYANPTWAMPFDLFRYSRPGVASFAYGTKAYFSINGGVTNLGDFNNVGGGDRSDWLSSASVSDLQSAYAATGRAYELSTSDLTALDALGWGGWVSPGGALSPGPSRLAQIGAAAAVPEPSTWAALIFGTALLGLVLRRRRQGALSAARN